MPQTKKSSPAKAAAARANGAKSAGPKTAAGKQKSSRNSFKHGATCSTRTPLLLPGENPAQLQLYTDAFYHHLCPTNLAEAALVDTLIAQVWKTARITGYEAELLTSNAEDLQATIHEEYESIGLTRLFALAFRDSAEKGQSPLGLRYLVSTRNMFRSALSDFIRLRQAKGNSEEPYLNPPRLIPVTEGLCIHPDDLPVPDPGAQPAEPATGFAVPPQEPQPPAPEPDPAPESMHETTFDEPPMIPSRDETGAIYLNMAGQPIMLPNRRYVYNPNVPQKPLPNYDISHFPNERFNTRLVPFDPRFTADGRLRNEPNPPANPPITEPRK